mgnify:CR=1 FL=1
MAIERVEYEMQFIQREYSRGQNLLDSLRQFGITTGDTVTYIERKMADAARQMNNAFKQRPMEMTIDDTYEFRYEVYGNGFKLKCWHDGREESINGPVSQQPDWLTGIVDVAKVAGHLKTPISPPPEAILWFTTDKNHTLIDFIELAP